MKRCTETHVVESFGEIPEGSLWPDDSEHVLKKHTAKFEDVPKEVPDGDSVADR